MAAKREKEQAERRKKKEVDFFDYSFESKMKDLFQAEAQRKVQLEKAKEAFEQWVQDKDTERKRLSEEKRLEKEEHDVRLLHLFFRNKSFKHSFLGSRNSMCKRIIRITRTKISKMGRTKKSRSNAGE